MLPAYLRSIHSTKPIDSQNLPGGVNWDDEIMQAIDHCGYFLLIWSANMEGSDYGRKEVERASQGDKTIIPILYSGDAGRLWDDIAKLQWIDFRDAASDGWSRLIELIPLPIGTKPPPDIQGLIAQGDMTFGGATRLWRSVLTYEMPDNLLVRALLLERTEFGIYSYLAGENQQHIQPAEAIQVFFNVSGMVDRDRFSDYLEYMQANRRTIWTVLIRGPIVSTGRGLEYTIPYDPKVWQRALDVAWRAIGKIGVERLPLQLYFNAPVALAAGFCAREHFRREVAIYQVNLTPRLDARDRYFLAYNF
jgi:hypothetical protein